MTHCKFLTENIDENMIDTVMHGKTVITQNCFVFLKGLTISTKILDLHFEVIMFLNEAENLILKNRTVRL